MTSESVNIITNHTKSHMLARKFCPKIFQEWKSVFDCVTGWVIADPDAMKKMMFKLVQKPIIPYLIQEDKKYYYAFYVIPHLFDWSDSIIKFINKLDSHLYDSEALCFRVNKSNFSLIDVATCFHHEMRFKKNTNFEVFVEAKGHGILPYEERLIKKSKIILAYNRKYKLQDLSKLNSKKWKIIEKAVSKQSKLPYEQAHEGWLREINSKHRRGDMYLRPHKLFKLAEEKGLLV